MRIISSAKSAVSFGSDDRGSVVILTAAFFSVAVILTAFAIDLGSLYTERRQLQGVADLAVIAAANDMDHADAAVRSTLHANGITATDFVVTLGHYEPDGSIAYSKRFIANLAPYNAVHLSVRTTGRTFFAGAFTQSHYPIEVEATGADTGLASFSIGSRLLGVNGGIINAVLGQMFGSNINLSVMDYQQLLSADVSLFPFLDALATNINLKGATYNQVLDSSVSVGDLFAAAASTSSSSGNGAAAQILASLGHQVGMSERVKLNSLISLGSLGQLQTGDTATSAYEAQLNALSLVTGSAALANGKNQVAVDLGASVPGILNLTVTIAIGEPAQQSPMVAVGQPGSTVSTAQTRVLLVAKIGGSGALAGATIRLPLALDLAYAEGTLAAVSCSDSGAGDVTIAARPGIADLWVGDVSAAELSDFSSMLPVAPATIVATPIASVTGSAHVNIGNVSDTMVDFDQSDITQGTIKQVDTANAVQSLTQTLLGDLDLSVNAGGLHLGIPTGLTGAVATQVGAVAAPLDTVIHSILTSLGVHVGQADLRVLGVHCGGGVIVG